MLGKNAKDRQVALSTSSTEDPGDASVSVVGGGMTVQGSCETSGPLRVVGTVEGAVRACSLEVTERGTIEGDALAHKSARDGHAFVIAGRVSGRVRASVVEVLPSGVVLGGIEADEAVIHGQVEGGVSVRRRLAVAETAVINGDIRTQRFVMEDGGRVNGTVVMGSRVGVEANESKPAAA
ncbi:MAG: polymer-forming cytoskeletal protein [Gemmatimonadota bacterium]|nr:polymer-forming cytoskeletal protein [Gemmatimonadota bacterium]